MTERKDKNTIKAKNKEQVEIEKQQLPWLLNHHSHEAFGGFEEMGLLKLNPLEASVLFLLTSNEWKLSKSMALDLSCAFWGLVAESFKNSC